MQVRAFSISCRSHSAQELPFSNLRAREYIRINRIEMALQSLIAGIVINDDVIPIWICRVGWSLLCLPCPLLRHLRNASDAWIVISVVAIVPRNSAPIITGIREQRVICIGMEAVEVGSRNRRRGSSRCGFAKKSGYPHSSVLGSDVTCPGTYLCASFIL